MVVVTRRSFAIFSFLTLLENAHGIIQYPSFCLFHEKYFSPNPPYVPLFLAVTSKDVKG
jgi:hypothetical protein